jgi:MoxR-like ATPase
VRATHRPLVIITSNNEKELPDAFLRRCFFHYIRFPDPDTMKQIVDVHHPDLRQSLVQAAMRVFYGLREVPGLKKRPSTSELLDWLKVLEAEGVAEETVERAADGGMPPLFGALLKSEDDVAAVRHLGQRPGRRRGR